MVATAKILNTKTTARKGTRRPKTEDIPSPPPPAEVDLSPVATMAMSKAISDKRASLARQDLSPGVYPVNEVIVLKGDLIVDEPTEARATTNLLSLDTVAFLLYRLGVKAPVALDLLREMAERTLTKARGVEVPLAEEIRAHSDMIEDFKKEFEKMAESLPKQKRAGAIRYRGTAVRLSGGAPTILRTSTP